MGSIRGFVMDESGHPVENATVAVPQTADFALSHQDGSFLIEDMPNGTYTFHVIQRYYQPFVFKFDIYGDMFVKGIALKPGKYAGKPYIGGEQDKISALEAKKSVEDTLLKLPGVVGVGLDQSYSLIRVYTTNCTDRLMKKLPREIAGFGVTVLCTGYIKPLVEMAYPPRAEYRVMRYRPVVGGISAAHEHVNAGTLGAVVRKRSGERMLLSNTHVFANRDMVGENRASHGDHILQPGSYDSARLASMGVTDNVVGHLDDWIKLDPYSDNIVDAAIAQPVNDQIAREFMLADETRDLIRVKGTRSVSSPISVKKYSRTTDVATGRVTDWDASVVVTYQGIPVKFKDQMVIEIDAIPGDSGSLILDRDNYAVGLLYGGASQEGRQFIFANKINNVFTMLDLKFGEFQDEKPAWATNIS